MLRVFFLFLQFSFAQLYMFHQNYYSCQIKQKPNKIKQQSRLRIKTKQLEALSWTLLVPKQIPPSLDFAHTQVK